MIEQQCGKHREWMRLGRENDLGYFLCCKYDVINYIQDVIRYFKLLILLFEILLLL
jgi:hypothetical protein